LRGRTKGQTKASQKKKELFHVIDFKGMEIIKVGLEITNQTQFFLSACYISEILSIKIAIFFQHNPDFFTPLGYKSGAIQFY
jgi:hypothetical protein